MKLHDALRPIAACATIGILAAACVTAPITGRKQLILISQDQEIQLGLSAYQEALREAKLSTDPQVNDQVQRVGRKIAQVANRPDYRWEFNVIDDDKTINAFALPGGKVAVYTGILKATENDAGLAAVLGHEVGHAIARHGAERISEGILAEIGQTALLIGMRNRDRATIQSVNAAFGLGVNVGVLLPFGRRQELEADHLGLILMARAGYDPAEAITFWTRMAAQGKKAPPEFLSTHPADERRIAELKRFLPEAQAEYLKAGSGAKAPG